MRFDLVQNLGNDGPEAATSQVRECMLKWVSLNDGGLVKLLDQIRVTPLLSLAVDIELRIANAGSHKGFRVEEYGVLHRTERELSRC